MADTIAIVTDDNDSSGVTRRAGLPRFDATASMAKVVRIAPDEMAAQLQEFLHTLDPVLRVETNEATGFRLDTIELSLAVNAAGGIELIGKMTSGVEASIKVTLKRKA